MRILWVICMLKLNKVNIKQLKKRIGIMAQINAKQKNSGFSLIESLLCLSLFAFILVSSFEFFISTRNHFFDLKEEQEVNQAAYATLDRVRLDVVESCRGLIALQSSGLLEAIKVDNVLTIKSMDMDIPLEHDLVAGQTFITLASTTGLKKGQELCITAIDKGEVKTITSVGNQGIALSSALDSSYPKDETNLLLVRTVSIYLDAERGVLRRKVNASPAQPLLEEVQSFDFTYDAASNILSICLTLTTREENVYETSIFPKNMALASAQ